MVGVTRLGRTATVKTRAVNQHSVQAPKSKKRSREEPSSSCFFPSRRSIRSQVEENSCPKALSLLPNESHLFLTSLGVPTASPGKGRICICILAICSLCFPAFNLNSHLKLITSCLSPQTGFNPLVFAFTFYTLKDHFVS